MKTIRHESLGIYIYAKPKNKFERNYNKRMAQNAEILRCRKFEAVINERYDFLDRERLKGDFLDFFLKQALARSSKWMYVYKHFSKYVKGQCHFGEIDAELCNNFKNYLLATAQMRHTKHKLHINSVAGYWSAFRAVLCEAYKNKLITEDINLKLTNIKLIPSPKEHLSQEELIRLAATPCSNTILRKAFLFSCLTGLRKSDIKKLRWDNIQSYGNGLKYITLRMQKTDAFINNPLCNDALELIGQNSGGYVFEGFMDKMTQGPLRRWVKNAGINKHISFHCARHTYCSLQLNAGTSVFVVQNMLGHKNINTTQLYAHLEDDRKLESLSRIKLV